MTNKLLCLSAVAALTAWLGTPETQAGSWSSLGNGLNGGGALGLAFDPSGNLYAGGQFTTATGGGIATNIARWSGSSWFALGSGMSDRIWQLASDANGNLFAAGSFTNASGIAIDRIAKWNGSAWTNLGSGMDATIRALACDTNGNLFAGGDFTNASGVAANHIAKWNPTNGWTNLGNGMNATVWSLACDTNGNLFAGGNFTTAGVVAATNVAKWNGSAWTSLGGESWADGSVVNALVFDRGNLYGAGLFAIDLNGGGTAVNVAKWNGSSWTNLNGGINATVWALACDTNGHLFAGGNFTAADGTGATNIAKWNGSAWSDLAGGMNDTVLSLARDTNGNIFAGGFFTNAGGTVANRIAKWSEDLPGWISIAPPALYYAATNGSGNPAAQTFAIRNNGQLPFAFTNTVSYSDNSGSNAWFTPSVNAGIVAAGGSLNVSGTVSITNLNVGVYYATNTITSTNAANSPQLLIVTLRVFSGTEGRFEIVPSNLTYTATNGIGDPAAQPFAVKNIGLTEINFTNTVSFCPSSGTNIWFQPSVTAGTVPADGSLNVMGNVSIANLGEGVYYATNTIASTNALNSPQILVVTLHVLNGRIGIVPATLYYMAVQDGANPNDQTFAVTNAGPAAGQAEFNFTSMVTYCSNSGTNTWFQPSVITGLVTTSGWLTITGSVNIANMTSGWYYATNTFTAPEATNSPQILAVTLHILATNTARLWVSPTALSNAVTEGQPDTFDIIQVANTGAAPRVAMTYTVTATSGPSAWLSVNPTNGVAQDNTNQLSVWYATAGLTAGWYTGRVDVGAMGEGVGTQSVNVILRVNRRPGVAWDAGSHIWTNEIFAGSNPTNTLLNIWNASGAPAGQMSYQVYALNDPYGWVSVSNASGVVTGDQQVATALVKYTTAGLAEGVYTAQLMLVGYDAATGQAATNGPLSVELKLTVKSALPILNTDVASISQTVLENYTGTNRFLVWNGANAPRGGMRYTVAANASWASVSPTTGTLTNETNAVLVTLGGGSLAAGTYNGSLTVDAWDAQTGTHVPNAPATIPLHLTVTPRTPQNLELPEVVGTLYVGQTVATDVGLWQNQERLSFGYQWERASSKAGDGREILNGEALATHAITTGDRGKYLRVAVTATDYMPYPVSTTAYSTWVDSAKVKALSADFNGDGITDLWFYDESTGTWRASFGTLSSASGVFGGRNMTAAPGDYDGDGNEDLAVFDRSNGIWHMLYLPRGAYAKGSLFGGTSMEAMSTPVPADYDGDGTTDAALYWMGYWAVRYSSTWQVNVVEPFAGMYGLPVPADWDGDGIAEMAVYENGLWSILHGNGIVTAASFGGGSMVLPAPADYDGDSIADLGVYDVGNNLWRMRMSQTDTETSVTFGHGGIAVFPGYYDHDSKADWCQAYLSSNDDFIIWEVKRTTETNFPYRGQSYQQTTGRWRVSW